MEYMPRLQFLGAAEAKSAKHFGQALNGFFVKVGDAITFLFGDESFHQGRIGCGDSHGAVIAVALEGLDAPQGEHHAAGRIASVSTQSESL